MEQIMNWLANKQTRIKDKRLVTLTIEIHLDGDDQYFPWTEEGFKAAYTMMYKHYDELKNSEDCWVGILADEGFEWSFNERISRRELSQKDYYKWWKFTSGQYNK